VDLSDNARRVFSWLHEEYIKADYPEYYRWGFAPEPGDESAFRELGAYGYIKPFTVRNWILTEYGLEVLLTPEPDGDAGVHHHHHGVTHMGSTFTTNITASTVGAFAQGDGAVATGHVTIGAPGPLTQEQHKTAISAAQTALVHDQDALERIDDRLYEALGQFLTLARKIQVEQQSLVEVQAQMKATLDEVWAQQEAKGMKPKLLPKGLEVVEVLAKSPITAEIAKKLLGA
jgi:hypothetical protein